MRHSEFGLRFAATVAVLAMAPTLALAYIDPGNGAYMVQALFALVGAGLFYLRHPIRTLKSAWQWCLHRLGRGSSLTAEDGMNAAFKNEPDAAEVASESLREHV